MNTRPFRLLSVFGLMLSFFAPAVAADSDEVQAQGWRGDRNRGRYEPPRITIFERPNFRGASLEIEMDTQVTDLRQLYYPNGGRVNNRIGSIHVTRGAQVRIYESDNFAGEFLDLTRSVENLTDMARAGGRNWGSAISSLRVFENRYPRQRWRDPSRMPRVIVFSRKNFQGQAFEIYPGESLENLSKEHFDNGEDLNAEISSVRVVGSVRLILHDDKRFRGERVEITRDIADLNQLRRADPRKDWNDKASSLSVEWVGAIPHFEPEGPADDAPPSRSGPDPREVLRPDKKPKPTDPKPGNKKPSGQL